MSINDFTNSLAAAAWYPTNLLDRNTYLATLEAYQTRLSDASEDLFVSDESEAEVAFRDWAPGPNRPDFARAKARNIAELRTNLGVVHTTTPGSSPATSITITKKDPSCRFVFLWAIHSQARLKITKRMALELFTYHQVMPSYLEFLLLFGQSSGTKDLRFSGFREQTYIDPRAPHALPNIERSGRQYELCYNLKSVDQKPENLDCPWSIRQAGFYHKFDIEKGTALWIITKGSLDLKDQIQRVTGADGRIEDRSHSTVPGSFRSSLAIHLMLVHWSCKSWRWYLQWLERKIDAETNHALFGARDQKVQHRTIWTPQDVQNIQIYQDKIYEIAMAIEANMEVISSLREFYQNLLGSYGFLQQSTSYDAVSECAKQMKSAVYDMKMQCSRASVLARIAGDRKNLILQHLQAQTTEQMERLTRNTISVGVSAQKEAITMRIITVVTLIFLPATFVSTFFSTDVVKYQNSDGPNATSATDYSALAMNRWLQVAVPLTAITLAAAWVVYRWERTRQKETLLQRGIDADMV